MVGDDLRVVAANRQVCPTISEITFGNLYSAGGGALGETRPSLGFIGSLLSLLRTHWDHEPLRLTEARSGPRVCDPQPARFMERRSLQNFDAHPGHERRRVLRKSGIKTYDSIGNR